MQGARAADHIVGPRSFEEVFVTYFDRVYRYMRVVLRNVHDAEDGVQQVFMQVYRALPAYDDARAEPLERWLFTIARNQAITTLRRRRSQPADPVWLDRERERRASPVSTDHIEWIDDARLLRFVEQLPAAQRQLIVLRYGLGFGTTDIAAVLDRDARSVRHLHHRALRTLERRLKEHSLRS